MMCVEETMRLMQTLDEVGYSRAQCNSHIISRCSKMEAVQTRGAVRFLAKLTR